MCVSKGNGGSSLVCGASGYREKAKGDLKSRDRYFIMNSKDQSLGSSLLQGLFVRRNTVVPRMEMVIRVGVADVD